MQYLDYAENEQTNGRAPLPKDEWRKKIKGQADKARADYQKGTPPPRDSVLLRETR